MMKPEYCFCFVVQAGKLEAQALLLASSLAKNARCSFELIGAVPSEYGQLQSITQKILIHLGVQLVEIQNPIDSDYPIGNKIACLQTAHDITQASKVIFLDTDIVCNKPFYGIDEIESYDVSMRIAGYAMWWANIDEWAPLYNCFQLPLPTERMVSAASNEQMPPYFNAGVIALNQPSQFPPAWLEAAKVIYQLLLNEPRKRHYSDQLALSIAIKKLDMRYQCLPTKYNSTTPPNNVHAVFTHYHSLSQLHENHPYCQLLLEEIYKNYPVTQYFVNLYKY